MYSSGERRTFVQLSCVQHAGIAHCLSLSRNERVLPFLLSKESSWVKDRSRCLASLQGQPAPEISCPQEVQACGNMGQSELRQQAPRKWSMGSGLYLQELIH